MGKFRSTQCPYCGKKLNPLETWAIKTEGEYKCPRCSACSNITLSSVVYLLAFGAGALGLLLFFITKAVLGYYSLWAAFWVIVPFLLFYVLSIFLVRLKKPVFRKNGEAPPQGQHPQQGQRTTQGQNPQQGQHPSKTPSSNRDALREWARPETIPQKKEQPRPPAPRPSSPKEDDRYF